MAVVKIKIRIRDFLIELLNNIFNYKKKYYH